MSLREAVDKKAERRHLLRQQEQEQQRPSPCASRSRKGSSSQALHGPPVGCGCTRRSNTVLSGRLQGLYCSQQWSTGLDSRAAGLAGDRRSEPPNQEPLLLCLAPSAPPPLPPMAGRLAALLDRLVADSEPCRLPLLPWLPLALPALAASFSRSLLLEGARVAAVCPVASTFGHAGIAWARKDGEGIDRVQPSEHDSSGPCAGPLPTTPHNWQARTHSHLDEVQVGKPNQHWQAVGGRGHLAGGQAGKGLVVDSEVGAPVEAVGEGRHQGEQRRHRRGAGACGQQRAARVGKRASSSAAHSTP